MGAGAGGVGVVGGVVPVGICTIGELEELLPPPPQAVSVAHRVSATKRLSVIKIPPTYPIRKQGCRATDDSQAQPQKRVPFSHCLKRGLAGTCFH